MDFILSAVKWQFSLVYLGDIVVFSKSPEDHIERIRSVVIFSSDASVTLKLRKYIIFNKTIDYLGLIISQKRLVFASHTTSALRKLQTPTSPTKLRSFPGLCKVF